MASSKAFRQRFSKTGRPPLASARSMNSRIPAPKSSENSPMNF